MTPTGRRVVRIFAVVILLLVAGIIILAVNGAGRSHRLTKLEDRKPPAGPPGPPGPPGSVPPVIVEIPNTTGRTTTTTGRAGTTTTVRSTSPTTTSTTTTSASTTTTTRPTCTTRPDLLGGGCI